MKEEKALKIIKEFIEGTPIWYESLFENEQERACVMCGNVPKKLLELSEALNTTTKL